MHHNDAQAANQEAIPTDFPGVVSAMAARKLRFSNENRFKQLLPFLETYFTVTKMVAEKSSQGSYQNQKDLERLDVSFARLYFLPLQSYMEFGSMQSPWRTYYAYSQRSETPAFLSMLLGINAHINGDLAHALVLADYQNRQDFLAINAVLRQCMRRIFFYLAMQHRDTTSVLALLGHGKAVSLFEEVIVTWRNDAWRQSQLGSQLPLAKVHSEAERIGEGLVELFGQRYNVFNYRKTLSALRSLRSHV